MVLENFKWAIQNGLLSSSTKLIPPTAQNFPVPKGDPQSVARGLIDAIAWHLGIEQTIDVRPLDMIPAEYRIDYNAMGEVGGTWQSDGNTSVITYDADMMTRPMVFLSTLVHEMMHKKLHMTQLDFPGAPEVEELATDLHCITCGLGEIQMSGAEQAGWQGYLRQETRAFAMAVCVELTGQQPTHLPARSTKLMRKCQKLVTGHTGWLDVMRGLMGKPVQA